MANSTYMDLTNELLRRLLEAQLTAGDFASARSTQATAKDCIRVAVNEIYAKEKEWPFRYTTGSQVLTAGTEEYTLPATCQNPDWESFYIQKDAALNINTTPLRKISRDLWYQRLRAKDEDSTTDGVSNPIEVFDSNYNATKSFGVTPSPDKAYTVIFDYYIKPAQLSLYDDEVLIPQEFDFVILNCALKHFYMHKDNTQQATEWSKEFDGSLNLMRQSLIDKKDDIRDSRTNFGGHRWRSTILGGYDG